MFRVSPSAICKYIKNMGLIRALKARRNEEVVEAKRGGRSTKELAGGFGLIERTVRRIAAGGRQSRDSQG